MLEKGARVALYSVVTNLPLVYVLYSKCHLQEGWMWKVQVEIFHEHSSEQGFSNVYNVDIDRILTWKELMLILWCETPCFLNVSL